MTRDFSEHDIRQAERYKALNSEKNRHSEGLAGYVTVASGLLLFSYLFFGAGPDEPLLAGVSVCGFFGGGGYWLYIRGRNRMIQSQMDYIERQFRSRGLYVDLHGDIRKIS